MLTWSLKQQGILLSTPEFYCPNCYGRRPFEIKPFSEAKTLYIILLFEPKDLREVVECQTCRNSFDPAILKPTNQSLFKLVASARNQLSDGTSPGHLKLKFMSDGVKEQVVDLLILLAQN